MSEEKYQEQPPINKEAEAAARAERERLFQSMTPQISSQTMAARMAESIGRVLGLDSDKMPADLVDSLKILREQLTSREPPPLEESQVPPSGE
jgi:hypothetical protein